MKPETKFKMIVAKALQHLPSGWFLKTQEVTIRGIPDYIICLRGYFIALELKASEDDALDALQEYNLKTIIEDGEGIACRVDPTNWPWILKNLQSIAEGIEPHLIEWPHNKPSKNSAYRNISTD